MTTYIKLKMDSTLYALLNENTERNTVFLVPQERWTTPTGPSMDESCVTDVKDVSEVAFRSEDMAAAEAYSSENFCITDWVDEYFSFTHDATKQGEALPVTEAQRIGFCMMDALGEVEPMQGDFLYAIAEKRAQHIGLNCSPGFLIFVASMSTSPGEVVMLIHAMRHQQDADTLDEKDKPKYVAADFWRIVEGKVPSREHLHKCWDAQKNNLRQYRVDNWLDVIAAEDRFIQATRDGYVRMQ